MIQLFIMFLGGGIALAMGTPLIAAVVGGIAGVLIGLAGIIWEQPKPLYIHPVNRPAPITRARQLLMAGGIALLGLFGFFVALKIPSGLGLSSLVLWYTGGMAESMALAILLTERRTREAQHRWLANMTIRPDPELKL